MTDFDVLKDIPGYKAILKAVLKNQIQMLVEQLSEQTGEESVILTASVSDGTLSHLGSESGKFFLEGHDEIKSQFLGFCLKRHHKRKSHDTLQVPQPKRFATATHSTSDFPPVTVNTDSYSSSHNPVFDSLSPSVHPVSLSKVKQKQRSPFTKAKVNRESLHIARLNVSLQQNFDPQKEHGLDMTTSNRSSSNLDSFSDTVDQNNLKSVGELRVNIKKEAVDSEEGTNNMTDKDKIGPSTEDIQERNDSVEETVKDNTVAAVKVEADDEDHELEITGVEGDISNQSLSDSQMYMQNFSGTDGQSSSIEVPPYNGDLPVRWLDESATIYQDPIGQFFGCGICDYKSPSKTNVKRHTRRHTCNQSERPVCEICHTSFIDKYKLRKHVEANHMGIRYMCQKCGRKFKSPYYLAIHKRCDRSEILIGSDKVSADEGLYSVDAN